jgi:alcohol dehydrogenase class IV
MNEFSLQPGQQVLSGIGSLDQLHRVVEKLGKSRAVLLTGKSLETKTDLVKKVEAALGGFHAGTFPGCQQHVPDHTVDAAETCAREVNADCVIAFGGGSPIDTAKIVCYRLMGDDDPREAMPQIAIPTTLSAGEYTGIGGITDTTKRIKRGIRDPRIVPMAVILDPEVTVDTPRELWATTGMKAFDHAVEAIWSVRAQPFTDTLAMEALRKLSRYLVPSIEKDALNARLECQLAAWMSIFGVASVGMRLTHPMGHQIGGRWDVPHGVTSCIVLPKVMKFLQPSTAEAQLKIAAAMGVDDPIEGIQSLIDSLDVPKTLSAAGVPKEELADCAHAISYELIKTGSPDAETATEEVLTGLLESMW